MARTKEITTQLCTFKWCFGKSDWENMKNLFHLVTARAVPSFLNFNGENISGDGIILSDMEFGIHTLSSSPFWKFNSGAVLCFWAPADFRSMAHLCRNVARHRCYWRNSWLRLDNVYGKEVTDPARCCCCICCRVCELPGYRISPIGGFHTHIISTPHANQF